MTSESHPGSWKQRGRHCPEAVGHLLLFIPHKLQGSQYPHNPYEEGQADPVGPPSFAYTFRSTAAAAWRSGLAARNVFSPLFPFRRLKPAVQIRLGGLMLRLCLLEAQARIAARRHPFFLAAERVFEPPHLYPGREDFYVKPVSIKYLI